MFVPFNITIFYLDCFNLTICKDVRYTFFDFEVETSQIVEVVQATRISKFRILNRIQINNKSI